MRNLLTTMQDNKFNWEASKFWNLSKVLIETCSIKWDKLVLLHLLVDFFIDYTPCCLKYRHSEILRRREERRDSLGGFVLLPSKGTDTHFCGVMTA